MDRKTQIFLKLKWNEITNYIFNACKINWKYVAAGLVIWLIGIGEVLLSDNINVKSNISEILYFGFVLGVFTTTVISACVLLTLMLLVPVLIVGLACISATIDVYKDIRNWLKSNWELAEIKYQEELAVEKAN